MSLIQQTLLDSAVRNPDKEAVAGPERRASYREIHEESDRLAAYLLSLGLRRGERVGIFSAKCVAEVTAIFAVLKAGGAFVHINPQYKERQLAHVIADCGIGILIVHPSKLRILAQAELPAAALKHVIAMSPDPALPDARHGRMHALGAILADAGAPRFDAVRAADDDIASVIYTSGSTGKPKGIIVTHRIFGDATRISAAALANDASDRLISVTPLSFDGALSQLFTTFLVGGTLVQQPSSFPRDIVGTLRDERITGFHSVPSLWGLLLGEGSPFARHEYPHLRYVSIIGEVLPERILQELQRLLPGTKLYLMYGTTEAFRSTYLVAGETPGKSDSVGRPFPGVEIAIEDDEGRPCPAGQVGGIVHRGVFVSPGYWNNPEAGARIFVDGAVRTGDLGRLDEDGYLYFAGRRDAMIKTQGYRVSPEEIERCLYEMAGVKEAAVVAVQAPDVGLAIKAVIAPAAGISLSAEQVSRHCRALLPPYMVPALIEFRPTLPRTANNKIQRSALV